MLSPHFLERQSVCVFFPTEEKKKDGKKEKLPGDPAFRRLLFYLLASTRGALNRVLILRFLKENPVNANKLSIELKLDYKTIQHHLKVLEENGLIVPSQKGVYGAVYFISPYLESEYSILEEIWAKVNKSSKEAK